MKTKKQNKVVKRKRRGKKRIKQKGGSVSVKQVIDKLQRYEDFKKQNPKKAEEMKKLLKFMTKNIRWSAPWIF